MVGESNKRHNKESLSLHGHSAFARVQRYNSLSSSDLEGFLHSRSIKYHDIVVPG